ncbi:hypothetical protein AVEN_63052-1 [Araneus ventricosus]|uniref:Uncharacterized protein n=1 Tax=Araneus ventricosus TaxID=182803 RepID=A0A4Y2JII2_ARAVE|nr:hypothetical protein AVEN_63052-1 [Araneus ventricosus]
MCLLLLKIINPTEASHSKSLANHFAPSIPFNFSLSASWQPPAKVTLFQKPPFQALPEKESSPKRCRLLDHLVTCRMVRLLIACLTPGARTYSRECPSPRRNRRSKFLRICIEENEIWNFSSLK